jgi:ribose 5-phosphate isomerase B
MKLYTGSDHAGFALRAVIVRHLRAAGHEVVDVGAPSEASTDYPDWAAAVGRAVRADAGAAGVLVCGSGLGVCIAANKLRGIRAADAWSVETARLARAHNDVNVLCLGARLLTERDALQILDVWLATPFEGGGRHTARLAKIAALEAQEQAMIAQEAK